MGTRGSETCRETKEDEEEETQESLVITVKEFKY